MAGHEVVVAASTAVADRIGAAVPYAGEVYDQEEVACYATAAVTQGSWWRVDTALLQNLPSASQARSLDAADGDGSSWPRNMTGEGLSMLVE